MASKKSMIEYCISCDFVSYLNCVTFAWLFTFFFFFFVQACARPKKHNKCHRRQTLREGKYIKFTRAQTRARIRNLYTRAFRFVCSRAAASHLSMILFRLLLLTAFHCIPEIRRWRHTKVLEKMLDSRHIRSVSLHLSPFLATMSENCVWAKSSDKWKGEWRKYLGASWVVVVLIGCAPRTEHTISHSVRIHTEARACKR